MSTINLETTQVVLHYSVRGSMGAKSVRTLHVSDFPESCGPATPENLRDWAWVKAFGSLRTGRCIYLGFEIRDISHLLAFVPPQIRAA